MLLPISERLILLGSEDIKELVTAYLTSAGYQLLKITEGFEPGELPPVSILEVHEDLGFIKRLKSELEDVSVFSLGDIPSDLEEVVDVRFDPSGDIFDAISNQITLRASLQHLTQAVRKSKDAGD